MAVAHSAASAAHDTSFLLTAENRNCYELPAPAGRDAVQVDLTGGKTDAFICSSSSSGVPDYCSFHEKTQLLEANYILLQLTCDS